MDMSSIGDITSLANLLKKSQESEEDDQTLSGRTHNLPPTAIKGDTVVKHHSDIKKSSIESNSKDSVKKNPKDIWDLSELPTRESIANTKDDRPTPRYEISYKQVVGSEDVFLGMSDKSPSSTDCTHLVIKVHFPQSSMKELDLDVTTNRIKAESKTHRLFTYLPQSVDSDNGKAKFDPKKGVLTVVLPIIRDF